MPVRLINTSREVLEFPTTQEAYDFVLSLDTPMAFRTDAPKPVCVPIDPESSPAQLSERTYAILPLTDEEKREIRDKLHSMVSEMKQGTGIPGMSDADADLLSLLAQSAEQGAGSASPSADRSQ
ncbi:hypothetical protein BGZ98_002709 [Dissophora globulifera]|nr:hypothetical protein BGZ98_002709 [Dissophora globulifera]